MNELTPSNGDLQMKGRCIVISESAPDQWQLESNISPDDLVCILLELAKQIVIRVMKKTQSIIAVPEMKVTLQ